MDISDTQLAICLDVLQQLAQHPANIDQDERLILLKPLITKLYRAERKAKRKRQKQRDRLHQESTTLIQPPLKSNQRSPLQPPLLSANSLQSHTPIHCYICKQPYHQIHASYHLLCPSCAVLNDQKRHARIDLSGRTALVTGGRIKIGYQTALRMLQDGARVIVTTRFPHDCACRYSQEPDFDQWCDRLQIYGLDLRNIPALEGFITHLLYTESALDILINNAAQTIKRPPSFYQHLLDREQAPLDTLPKAVQAVICWSEGGRGGRRSRGGRGDKGRRGSDLELKPQNLELKPQASDLQIPLDCDGQSLDLRPLNSWLLKLGDVSTVELLEVQVVNAIAPFILNSKLKSLLMASPFERRFIINVSAMEGQFNRDRKTTTHPHTNMAKAALNMMTRTSAQDYASDNIFMNSVDTGWITNENPYPKAQRLQTEDGFYPPLDIIDGMARIYDPIVQGLQNPDPPLYGYFLKDYLPYPW